MTMIILPASLLLLLLLSRFSRVRLIDGSPPGSPVPRILQARILEWVAISFFNRPHYPDIILKRNLARALRISPGNVAFLEVIAPPGGCAPLQPLLIFCRGGHPS